MQIESVAAFPISIALDEPISWSTGTISARDHSVVVVRTEDGIEGIGYTLGYGASHIIAQIIDDLFTPLLVGKDPRDTQRLWSSLFESAIEFGRSGLALRAISMLDIAFWDIKARAAGQPLYKLLGGTTDSVPVYASGGYYRDGKGFDGLRDELRTYVERGNDAVKIKVGGRSLKTDLERAQIARECVGEDGTLLLDATCAYETEREALTACRAFGAYDPYFIEEPVMPDRITLMSAINDGIDYPVAAGEIHETRYRFDELLRRNAIGVVQADATVVGGITEWMRVAHHAEVSDVPMAPHYNWDLHVQLLAAIENGLWAEYFYRDIGVKVLDDVLAHPLIPENGHIELPERSGHGVRFDDDALESARERFERVPLDEHVI